MNKAGALLLGVRMPIGIQKIQGDDLNSIIFILTFTQRTMKNVLELNEKKVPIVSIDKSLNKYDNIVLFPEKVKKAKEAFEKFGVPDLKEKSR